MSAEIELSWGDAVLCREIVERGERFVVGAEPGADFVAPVETHVVSVDESGEIRIEARGSSRPLRACGNESIGLGPLTFSVAHTLPEVHRFGSSAWLLDLGGLALVMAYAFVVSALSFTLVPDRVTAERFELDGYFPTHRFGFSIELEPGEATFPVPRPALPAKTKPRAIFAETKARRFGSHPRNQGISVQVREADERRGGTGARARGDEGAIGNPYAPRLVGIWAMQDRDAIRLAKDLPRKSWICSLAWPEPAFDEELVAEWGEEADDSGHDTGDVVGNMYGDEPVDPDGSGLGVTGVKRGGGGEQARRLGTGRSNLGHGIGSRVNDGRGVVDAATFRRDVGLARHVPLAPTLGTGVAPEVIDRVLGRAGGHFRACGDPGEALEFDIDPDGVASNANTRNPCVLRVLSRLRFLPAGTRVTRARGRLGL